MSVLQQLKSMGCASQHLDILVQDQKMQAANKINSAGMEAQVDYLLTRMTGQEVVAAVEHEFTMLRRYNMQFQSKVAEGNVKIKKRKV